MTNASAKNFYALSSSSKCLQEFPILFNVKAISTCISPNLLFLITKAFSY